MILPPRLGLYGAPDLVFVFGKPQSPPFEKCGGDGGDQDSFAAFLPKTSTPLENQRETLLGKSLSLGFEFWGVLFFYLNSLTGSILPNQYDRWYSTTRICAKANAASLPSLIG